MNHPAFLNVSSIVIPEFIFHLDHKVLEPTSVKRNTLSSLQTNCHIRIHVGTS